MCGQDTTYQNIYNRSLVKIIKRNLSLRCSSKAVVWQRKARTSFCNFRQRTFKYFDLNNSLFTLKEGVWRDPELQTAKLLVNMLKLEKYHCQFTYIHWKTYKNTFIFSCLLFVCSFIYSSVKSFLRLPINSHIFSLLILLLDQGTQKNMETKRKGYNSEGFHFGHTVLYKVKMS